jgi:hypothetical protein
MFFCQQYNKRFEQIRLLSWSLLFRLAARKLHAN